MDGQPQKKLVTREKDQLLGLDAHSLKVWLGSEQTDNLLDVCAAFLWVQSSQNTLRTYKQTIERLLHFLREHYPHVAKIGQVTSSILSHWQRSLFEEELHNRTIFKHTTTVSSLFLFAMEKGVTDENPTLFLKKPHFKTISTTAVLSKESLKGFLQFLEERATAQFKYPYEKKVATLRYALFTFLFHTGLRVSEAIGLKYQDLSISQEKSLASVRVWGKGSKKRTVIFSLQVYGVVLSYIKNVRPFIEAKDFLFTAAKSRRGKPLTQYGIYQMLNEELVRAGVTTQRLSPHSCRATLATVLHDDGVSIQDIKEQLGHSHIQTTSIYIRKEEEVAQSAARMNLLDSLKKR